MKLVAKFDRHDHDLTLTVDYAGCDRAVCLCGWSSPPMPGADVAAEAWADHLLGLAFD